MERVFRLQASFIPDSSIWFTQTGSLKFSTNLVENLMNPKTYKACEVLDDEKEKRLNEAVLEELE
jgi:hypothetical protein